MKLIANNKVVDSDYELAPNDEIRIRPLMEDINNQNIEFKYLITMNYPYRVTDYTRVMYDSKWLRHVIESNCGYGTKFFITNEKHTCSRNIFNELDDSIIDNQKYIDNFNRFTGKTISRYGSIHRHICIDTFGTSIREIDTALRKFCRRDYHFTQDGSGCDIRRVYNQEKLMSYMTKDIDRPNLPNLNIERDKVIDSVNSDIGKNHYSVNGLDACESGNQLKKTFEKLYKSDGTR